MLKVGDTIHASSLSLLGLIGGSNYSATVRAHKGQGILLLVLGEEPLDGSATVDVEGVMAELGWVPTPDRLRVMSEAKAAAKREM